MLDLLKFDISANNSKAVGALRNTRDELRGIKGALVSVGDQARRAGRGMRNIGAGMSAAITAPLTLLGKQSVQLFDIQRQAEDAVGAVIKSTGGAAQRSLGDLKALASEMQGLTTFGDEDILQGVTAPLLTFTKIQGDVFDRAQMNVLDMATLLKMDLKSASLLVGKALNDPIKGISALSRSGIQFTESQKDVIKALVETGDVAGAQAVILRELETQFGGQAAAAANAPLGQWRQLQNAIGDVKEELGAQIVPFLKPLVENVKEAVSWFAELSPEVKKNIVVFGGIAAAAGPVLAFFGLATLGVTGLAAAFVTLASPLGLAVLGFAAVAAGAAWVVANWDALINRFPALQGIADLGGKLRQAWSNLPSIKWALLIPALRWARFVPLLGWLRFIPVIPWAGLAGKLTWGALIKPLIWGARFIPGIGWIALAGALLWTTLIKPLVWDGYLSKINWSDWIPQVNWDNFLGGSSAGSKGRRDARDRGNEVGSALGQGLAEGIGGGAAAGSSAARRLMRSAIGAAEQEGGIQSPSRVFREIGGYLSEGLAIGIGEKSDAAVAAMRSLGQQVNAEGQKTMGFLGNLKGGINTILTDVLNRTQSFGDSLRGVLGGFGKQMQSVGIGKLTDFVFSALGFARGAAFDAGRVTPFAAGGVVNGPTMFPMRGGTGLMGEAGPEAIMPLTRIGGRLGVRATQAPSASRDRMDLYVHPSGEFDTRVQGVAANVYSARERGTIRRSVQATYRANGERPLR